MRLSEYRNGGAYITAAHGEALATKLTEAQAIAILKRLQHRQRLQGQARELSNTSLGAKFGMHHKSIDRIANGHRKGNRPYRHIDLSDYDLIRQCVAERDRLKSLAAEHSDAVLAKEYGVSVSLVQQIGMGTRWRRLPLKLKDATC